MLYLDKMSEEKKQRDLLLRATRDKEFREELLRNPKAVAEKNKVKFTDEQLEKIKLTASFVESLKDIVVRIPVPPIYPLYPILHRWRLEEFNRVIKYYITPIIYPVPFERLRRDRFRLEIP
jgi:hypothetical protein